MKKYLAWVCFVLGSVYLGSLVWKVANGTIHDAPPALFQLMHEPTLENLLYSLVSFVPIIIISTLWYLWYRWK